MMNSFPKQTVMPCKYDARCKVCGKGRQQGAVLIVGLILLMMITLLALAGIQGTSLQERMSGNAYDRNIAFNTAEVGLRWAELQLLQGVETGGSLGGFHDVTDAEYLTGKADVAATTKVTGITEPKIAVVDLDGGCFMVNSEGQGKNTNTVVVLQSVVCRD